MKSLRPSHVCRQRFYRGIKARSAASLLGISILLSVGSASAESATITMKSGEVTHADVVSLEFGKHVRVKQSDGSEKTIPWSEIQDLKMDGSDESDAAPVAAGELPVLEEAPPAESEAIPGKEVEGPTKAEATTAPPTAKVDKRDIIYNELTLVDREISDAKADMPVVGGPITLALIGLGVGGLVIASTINAESNCGSYCNLGPSYGIGVFNLGVGVIGTIWVGAQLAARGKKADEIEQLEARRDRLKLDLQSNGSGAVGSLSLRF